MIEQRWVLFLVGWAVVAALQAALYLRQRRTRDATLVDAGWAFSLALLAVLYAVLAPGAVEHRVLVAIIVSVESLRIAWLVVRRIGHGEDTRYAELRTRWRERLTLAARALGFAPLAHGELRLGVEPIDPLVIDGRIRRPQQVVDAAVAESPPHMGQFDDPAAQLAVERTDHRRVPVRITG